MSLTRYCSSRSASHLEDQLPRLERDLQHGKSTSKTDGVGEPRILVSDGLSLVSWRLVKLKFIANETAQKKIIGVGGRCGLAVRSPAARRPSDSDLITDIKPSD